jgi:putative flippase GtrA
MTNAEIPETRLGALVRSDKQWVVLLRFLAVGGSFTLLMMLLALTFSASFGMAPQLAQGLAHALCVVPTYLSQRAFAFRSDVRHSRGLTGYVLMQLPLLALGSGLAWLLIANLHWPRVTSLAVIAVVVALTSFFVQRIIFARKAVA